MSPTHSLSDEDAQPPSNDGQEELVTMGLLEHLEELRDRLLIAVAAFAVAFFASWAFSGPIYDFLAQPIYRYLPEGEKLAFLGITDPFVIYVKVAALAAVFAASPIILWQLWAFVSPGLYRRERLLAGPFVLFGSLLFLAGGAFAYYVAFPFAVEFLLGMGERFQATITVDRYLSFLMTVILGLGLMFELPTVIFFLARLGVVTPRFLLRHFRWAVLLIFVAAAIITPTPDVINLLVFALPTIGLYLVGVGVAALFGRPREPSPRSSEANR
ncbi:MAG: twin-arginine translocase subunit TatC [Thermoanaerobaculia bacterium]|nr:twin-arginine translocase subunit TatC [Thermoanaerobaculia bacterium]